MPLPPTSSPLAPEGLTEQAEFHDLERHEAVFGITADNAAVRRRLRYSLLGNIWISGTLAILGIGLLVVGLIFWTQHPFVWATALGYTLLGLAAFAAIGIIYHHKVLWGSTAITLTAVGVVVLVGHYLGYW